MFLQLPQEGENVFNFKMLTDKYGYPIEFEVKLLEHVNKSIALKRKMFNVEILNQFGKYGYEIICLFWKNKFLRQYTPSFKGKNLKGNKQKIILTPKGETYLKNMIEELNKLKLERKRW